jgi:hypothetical protein
MSEERLWEYRSTVRTAIYADGLFEVLAFVRAETSKEARKLVKRVLVQRFLREVVTPKIECVENTPLFRELSERHALEDMEEGRVGFFLMPLPSQ